MNPVNVQQSSSLARPDRDVEDFPEVSVAQLEEHALVEVTESVIERQDDAKRSAVAVTPDERGELLARDESELALEVVDLATEVTSFEMVVRRRSLRLATDVVVHRGFYRHVLSVFISVHRPDGRQIVA